MLFDALARGITSQGADVIDVGLVTTPMLYYAVGEYDLHDAGIMITASHNPKEYNGFKLCLGDVSPIGAESGMDDIRQLVLDGPYPEIKTGAMVTTDIKEAYVQKLFSMVDVRNFQRLNVAVDTGNGMEGSVIHDIFKRLPMCTMSGLCLEPDGSFPNHEANPLKEETLDMLKERIRDIRADIGIAFDGDGDRIGLVDEKGGVVRGDLIVALLAPTLFAKETDGLVFCDVRGSMIVPETIISFGGRAGMCHVGHGLIKPRMRRENALFAGELSGHFYFRDFYGSESTDLVMLLVFALMSETGKKLSELVAPLQKYFHSGEINFKVENKDEIFQKLTSTYGHEATAITTIDGIRMDFSVENKPEEDWWFSVRASNTEPLLRLNLEAKKREKMEQKQEELQKIIQA